MHGRAGSGGAAVHERYLPQPDRDAQPVRLAALVDDGGPSGVQAIRAYLAGYAKAVSEGDFTIIEVTENATPELVARAASLAEDERGLQYPGPVPFTPLNLSVDTETRKDVLGCGYSAGYAVDPATGKPPSPPDIKTWEIVVEQSDGRWKVSGIYNQPTVEFSCSGVTVQEVPW